MKIGIIAAARHALVEPYAGGMEAHTVDLARGLRRRGHEVSVFGPAGSPPDLVARTDELTTVAWSGAALRDVSAAPTSFLDEHHAYLALMLRLQHEARARFDVVHDNAIHYLTLSMARTIGVPTVATLHTPPTPWAESALAAAVGIRPVLRAVSASNARSWAPVLGDLDVIPNGVDTRVFVPGAGGGPAVWSGRLVPEKGADHAVAAARRAGMPLRLAGPVGDAEWFAAHVRPALGDGIEYVGHLPRAELVALLGSASVVLSTPRWDEPFGLVVAEALACATPVASYDRGATAEILDESCGVLAPPDDLDGLAAAMLAAAGLPRSAARRRAVSAWSADAMVTAYEELYRSLAAPGRGIDRRRPDLLSAGVVPGVVPGVVLGRPQPTAAMEPAP